MQAAGIHFERDGAIATITIDAPETRNAITDPPVLEALLAAVARLDDEEGIRAGILTGAGPAFSSGGNIREMTGTGTISDARPVRTRSKYRRGIQRLPLLFSRLEVPVIAAINGPAYGAGLDLACMCDLRIAAESAKFAESFVKLGLISGDGGSWLLPRLVGFSKASEMALTGDAISAQEALACGLVSNVVPDDALMEAARALAMRIAANPPHAVRLTKRLLWESREMTLSAALDLAGSMQALCHATGDHAEAVSAFLEKRAPEFEGE